MRSFHFLDRHRMVRRALRVLAAAAAFVVAVVGSIYWYFHPAFEHQRGIVYTQRHGHDLTLEVLRPKGGNGLGILILNSGGWRSDPDDFRAWFAAPLLRRGYTVLVVSHLSQPEATVMEIIQDMHRAVRFIRHHARDYGIAPHPLGVSGGSAGGHLSLMLATRGGPGPADAADPIDRESSAVQAVAIFFPVTDLLNLGSSTENPGDGGPPKSFVRAFGPDSTNLTRWKIIGRDTSPIYHITSNLPPVLILHGDADTLTPLEQSQWFREAANKAGGSVEIGIHHGGKHGWLTMVLDIRQFARWFDRQLRP